MRLELWDNSLVEHLSRVIAPLAAHDVRKVEPRLQCLEVIIPQLISSDGQCLTRGPLCRVGEAQVAERPCQTLERGRRGHRFGEATTDYERPFVEWQRTLELPGGLQCRGEQLQTLGNLVMHIPIEFPPQRKRLTVEPGCVVVQTQIAVHLTQLGHHARANVRPNIRRCFQPRCTFIQDRAGPYRIAEPFDGVSGSEETDQELRDFLGRLRLLAQRTSLCRRRHHEADGEHNQGDREHGHQQSCANSQSVATHEPRCPVAQ